MKPVYCAKCGGKWDADVRKTCPHCALLAKERKAKTKTKE